MSNDKEDLSTINDNSFMTANIYVLPKEGMAAEMLVTNTIPSQTPLRTAT